MAKPRSTTFTDEFEPILISAWGEYGVKIDKKLQEKTRKAIKDIRKVYRFKEKFPSRISFRGAKNRAGYLAAFGQRHAYLSYWHLKKIQEYKQSVIPQPSNGCLTVTIIGAGAALEVYGLCLFYNEERQKLKRLNLNLIEKINEWKPTRHVVFGRLLKDKFPKINILPIEIDADVAHVDCIKKFAENHDALISTDLLLIYNVLNEIETKQAQKVFRNLKYILRQAEKPLLILIMEPSAKKAQPRVNWLRERLAEISEIIIDNDEEEILFISEPICINLEDSGEGLNDRLFSGKHAPHFENSLKRTHVACFITPQSPISAELIKKQLDKLQRKRQKGKFVTSDGVSQLDLF